MLNIIISRVVVVAAAVVVEGMAAEAVECV